MQRRKGIVSLKSDCNRVELAPAIFFTLVLFTNKKLNILLKFYCLQVGYRICLFWQCWGLNSGLGTGLAGA
jgi:hypothetical protein